MEHANGLGIVKVNKLDVMIMDEIQAADPLVTTCHETLQHLDEIETKLAALFEEIEIQATLLQE
jgi:hypothetical protein